MYNPTNRTKLKILFIVTFVLIVGIVSFILSINQGKNVVDSLITAAVVEIVFSLIPAAIFGTL